MAGVQRGYWLARGPEGLSGPLLMVLHGSGTNGKDVATLFTGLATRGPAAGVTAVFPDGWQGVWHIARPPRGAPALDDAGFLAALARSARATPVVLAGISNGAGFAEHVARHGLLRVAGLFLVAGTFREFSQQAQPVPRQRAAVTILAGTADPAAPYQGGPMRMPGAAGWILRRRAARHGDLPSERRAAPVETVARDWAAANGAVGARSRRPSPGASARGPAGDPADLVRSRRPAGGAVPDRGRRARLAGRPPVSARPGHRARPPPPGRHRSPPGPGVSGDGGAPSGLERVNPTTEALMMAEGEQAGAGHA